MAPPSRASVMRRAGFVALLITSMFAVVVWRALQDYPTRLFDLYPLYYGGLAWIHTGSAYALDAVVPATDQGFQILRVGNTYPLPAVLVTLPLTLLQPQVAGTVWVALLVGGLIGALRLHRGSFWFLLYLPILEAVRIEQYTAFVVIMQIVALWALKERRWWILAACCALILTKPNHGLMFVLAMAVLSGKWRSIALATAALWGASFAMDPSWLPEWVAALVRHDALLPQPFLWPIAFLAVPLLLVRDLVGAAVILQFVILPFPGIYAASALPLSLLRDPRVRWLTAASFLWPFPAILIGTPWATALTLVIPLVALVLYVRRGGSPRAFSWPDVVRRLARS